MHMPILKKSAFLNELSKKGGDGPNLFIFSIYFGIHLIWFIFMQQETRNHIENHQTVKASIESRPERLRCIASS
jgi:hypothetical protein